MSTTLGSAGEDPDVSTEQSAHLLGGPIQFEQHEAVSDHVDDVDVEDDEAVKPPRRHVIYEWLFVIVCSLTLSILLQMFVVQAFSIPSRSMLPTLSVGERIFVYKLGYGYGDISRGDVVVFDTPTAIGGDDDLIKRVIGLGGETLEIRDGSVYVDGQQLHEPYLFAPASTDPTFAIPGCENEPSNMYCQIPEDHVFVLGDNRAASRDGRYFGPIHTDTVIGRAFATYWPPNDIGGL